MIRIALDLELWCDGITPPTDIIQIGYCAFDDKQIIEVGGDYIIPTRPLPEYITRLTKITQKDIDEKGIDILTGYENILTFCKKHGVEWRQLVTWGAGDLNCLKSYIPDTHWKFGRTECNLKTLAQLYFIANNIQFRGGLKKSMNKLGIPWEVYKEKTSENSYRQRSEHNAICDAINTAKVYIHFNGLLNAKKAPII